MLYDLIVFIQNRIKKNESASKNIVIFFLFFDTFPWKLENCIYVRMSINRPADFVFAFCLLRTTIKKSEKK